MKKKDASFIWKTCPEDLKAHLSTQVNYALYVAHCNMMYKPSRTDLLPGIDSVDSILVVQISCGH